MKPLLAILTLLLVSTAATPVPQGPDASDLVGVWRVDLRPTPDAAPYYRTMTIEAVEDGQITGSFYGSKIKIGHVNTDWDAVHFAFVTKDGRTAYHTTGRLVEGRLEGTTHAPNRDFLSVWSAERE